MLHPEVKYKQGGLEHNFGFLQEDFVENKIWQHGFQITDAEQQNLIEGTYYWYDTLVRTSHIFTDNSGYLRLMYLGYIYIPQSMYNLSISLYSL